MARFARRDVTLVFDEDSLAPGAHVRCRLDVDTEFYLDLFEMRSEQDKLREAYAKFTSVIIEWDLEDDAGEPLPVDLLKAPPAFAELIMVRWLEAVAGVPDPLGETSSAGVPPDLGTIPMESLELSESLGY